MVTLKNAMAAVDRGGFVAGKPMLQAFINKAKVQLRAYPQLREKWTQLAQEIGDGLTAR